MPHIMQLQTHCRRARFALHTLIFLMLALTLAGCGTTSQTGLSGRDAPGGEVMSARAAAYDTAPGKPAAILGYAEELRSQRRYVQAEAVLRKGVLKNPGNRDIAAAYGKVLAINGKLESALEVVRNAQKPDQPDWRLLSAEAAIHDQMGNVADARQLYEQALRIVPDEPSILNNYGLSFILAGENQRGHDILKRAASMTSASSQIRQNYALALGLIGQYDEALRVAGREIGSASAQRNIDRLRKMRERASHNSG